MVTFWFGCPRFGYLAWRELTVVNIHCYKHFYKHKKATMTMYTNSTALLILFARDGQTRWTRIFLSGTVLLYARLVLLYARSCCSTVRQAFSTGSRSLFNFAKILLLLNAELCPTVRKSFSTGQSSFVNSTKDACPMILYGTVFFVSLWEASYITEWW
jgi:hypothetical protein